MARPTQLKCTNKELKDCILNFLIDDKGKRRSIRDLVTSESFIKFSGLKPSPKKTTGTITYHMKKLKINEQTLFEYAIKTGRIPQDTKFEDFTISREKKGIPLQRIIEDNENISCNDILKWKKIAKVLELPVDVDGLGIEGFKEYCYMLGYNDKDLEQALKVKLR